MSRREQTAGANDRDNAADALETVELTPETVAGLIELAEALRRIHLRLLREGYRFECGKILPPHRDI